MLKSFKTSKTRLPFIAGALFLLTVTGATAGYGQNNAGAFENRLHELENQIQTLSRAVYRGDKNAAASLNDSGASTAAMSTYEDRLSQIEQQQRDMTGQIERLTYDVQQMKQQLEKAQADNDMRFRDLGGVSTPPSAPAAATTSTEAPSATSGTLGTLSTSGGDPATTLYESAFADIRSAEYASAETKLNQFMSLYANHALAANAQYWLGETYYVRGDYKKSAKTFAQSYQDHPKGPKAADSLLKLGLSLGRLDKKDDACLSFAQLKKQFTSEQSTVVRRADQEMKSLGCK